MKIRTSTRSLFIALLSGAALALSGCGSSADEGASTSAAPATRASKPAAKQPAPSREVVVIANDQMKFDLATIEAAAGETIKLTLLNQGSMPKFSMGHNIAILDLGVDVNAFAEAAATSPTTEYIPASYQSKIVAHTKLLGGGESDSIVFTAPSAAGKYPFICTFPGHLQVGMRGDLVIK